MKNLEKQTDTNMSKEERIEELMKDYMNEYDPEVIMTMRWNLGEDDIIELLENREGREIIIIDDGDDYIDDAEVKYAYK